MIPLDAIRDALEGVEVLHEVGCTAGTKLPLVDALPTYPIHDESADPGLTIEYYDNMACAG